MADAHRAKRDLSPVELRSILDRYLQGRGVARIAQEVGRKPGAIKHLVEFKIPSRYDEKGKRTSLLEKMVGQVSMLDSARSLDARQVAYFISLCHFGRSDAEIGLVMNLYQDRVAKLRKEYGPGDTDEPQPMELSKWDPNLPK